MTSKVYKMREKIIDLMERTLSAYTDEHIKKYFDEVLSEGLSEHGFPRLTANIGILIAHGRRRDLLPLFLRMMEFCCRTIPTVKAANDFSVREIISSICELEESGAVSEVDILRWKSYLRGIKPESCYNVYATSPEDRLKNWALFTAVSEFYRMRCGLGGSEEFIETQLATQLRWLDENGMYMDGKGDTHHPIVYDFAARGLFSLLLDAGYRGKYYTEIDTALRKAGLLSLGMQSPNGELAFGGRSNQFLHNEPWLIAVLVFEAKRYIAEGDTALAREFSSAIGRALEVTENWLSLEPIRHIKNRFPTETRYGCEAYAYFDKYMITVASNLHAAYQMCDGRVEPSFEPDILPFAVQTTEHFHKLFIKAGGYGLEFDLDGDPHYDASGLGRVHRADAPSAICLSVPCPGEPSITVDIEKPTALSLCPGVVEEESTRFATDPDCTYEVVATSTDESSAYAILSTAFADGREILSEYSVDGSGVSIKLSGEGNIAFMLPVFHFDGESYTEIKAEERELSVLYGGWICRTSTDSRILETDIIGANRNGHYKEYFVSGENTVNIKIEIIKV